MHLGCNAPALQPAFYEIAMRIPTAINLNKKSQTLTIRYNDQEHYELPAEFLRVHSPSAEVQGHGNPVLQTGKMHVGLTKIEPAGQYAIKITFSDGHDSGLFSWDYLDHLSQQQAALWQDYLDALAREGKSRDPDVSPVKLML